MFFSRIHTFQNHIEFEDIRNCGLANRLPAVTAKTRAAEPRGSRVTPRPRTHDATPRDLPTWSTVVEAAVDGRTNSAGIFWGFPSLLLPSAPPSHCLSPICSYLPTYLEGARPPHQANSVTSSPLIVPDVPTNPSGLNRFSLVSR